MIPASLAGKACRKASNRVQTDTFLLEHDRFERVYQCRKTRFQALQQQKDTSIESIFILSDDEPWEVFRKTNTTEGRMQRRKLVFERCRDFPVLHQACIDGDRDQVHSLLNTPGVCVLERDACGRIALHHAVIKEHFKIVKRLLRRRDAKVQTHVRDNSNRTALHYVLGKMEVLARHRKRLNIPALITTEMRVESKRYRRLWELADRMLEMFSRKELEAVGEDGESIKVLDMRCRGDVWDVCRSGDLERLEMFVKVYGCSKDEWQLSELKRTLLHEACENQQLQVVYFLIVTMDVPVLAQDTSGCTALHCAARRGYLDGCQMLLGKAANGENSQLNDSTEELVLVQDDRGRTALHWCLLGSCDPLIRLQLAVLFAQSFPAVLHICDQDGVAPLALAIWRGEIELVQEFISLGANVCASARIPQSPYGKNVEKASWAPCGIAFQRRCLRKLVKVVPRSDPTDNVPDITRSPECSKKHVINWENLQHPVEALWYWTQRSNEGNSAFNEKRIINEENKLSDSEPATTEEELGCRKYGGICRRCESFTSGYSVKTPPSPPNVSESRLCRPLLLALRMCALRLDSGSMLNDRVVIVELLLTNGASPDENCDGEYLSNHAKQVNSIDPSALSESLRSSLQYSQIIPMLRQYGADQLSIHSLMRWCVSVPSTAAKQVESVLSQLLDLENVASSSDFLTMLFHQKHFVTLCELWSNKAQNFSPSTIAAGSTDRECNWLRGISPWKCIHETLVAWSEPKKRPVELGNIDVKHLEFLCGLVHPRLDIPADKDDILHDRGAWELFDFCVDLFLRQRDNDRHSNSDFTPNHSGISLREQTLLRCIQILFKYWKHYEDADQRMKSQVSRWLEPSILRGYFDCSLVILETLHRLGGTSTLLDTVFELYSSAVGTRTSVGGEQLLHHREFLIVCAENLLKVNTSRSDEQTNLPKSTVVASARSIVHMCANNLLFPLVESCFDTVFPESTQDKSNALAAIKSVRVGRKTMVQWILVHDRYDIMRWLLKLLPPGIERGLCWSAFVAAATVNGKESITTPSSGDVLFSVYVEDVQTHLGVNERKDLVINLILRTAIPTDSVALLERLLNFWGASGPNCCDPSDAEHFGNYLKPVGVLHAIARWNAVRVAEFCLSGQCASEYQINQVNWQQIFSEENQHCHVLDGCTPLELCRLLGHYQLYKFLSSRLQTSLPEAQTDDVVENIIVESPENKDSDRSPKLAYYEASLISTTPWWHKGRQKNALQGISAML
ncbi:Ankyrin repeat-containing domain [Phytophthora cactorum]|nr:Ankyrin repeat-containing domain [Phytophthora cactorum]